MVWRERGGDTVNLRPGRPGPGRSDTPDTELETPRLGTELERTPGLVGRGSTLARLPASAAPLQSTP